MKRQFELILLSFLVVVPRMALSQNEEAFYRIGGTVKNAKNKKSIEYVQVAAVGTNVATIANADGEFVLKINKDLPVTEIELSCIGYYNARYDITQATPPDRVFYLSPHPIELKEIEVLSWKNPADLIEAAIDQIEHNYSPAPQLLKAFYRETIQKGKKYINISEAVMDIYKSSYLRNAAGDRVQVLKGRKLLSPRQKDTLAVKLLGGPNMAVFMDVVKNPEVLLDKECLPFYAYQLKDAVSIDDRLQYAVQFKPQGITSQPLYSGIFYIDQETLSFTRIEFNMEMRDKAKVTDLILKNKPRGLRFTPDNIAYIVSYKQQEGKTHLNYIRNEIQFKCDWKKRLFSTRYTVTSEMVVTGREQENVSGIAGKNAFSTRKSLGDEVMLYYDADFWGAYNIIEPTESLESAIGKLYSAQEKTSNK
ncbi:MAG: carboxypeptidase-like regulatory domain-containing protein [Dysgonamonadaceae bacterium]|jgi:hypothetical protein|nr:carboxypeptidase-like regulatory domain-containing protein [Dysgonamonadaceae bacterium]